MRFFCLILPLLFSSCGVRIEQAATGVSSLHPKQMSWKGWQTSTFARDTKVKTSFDPDFVRTQSGELVTYGPRLDGTEHFAVISKREENPKTGIFPLRLSFIPTSMFAGPSPLDDSQNNLFATGRKWFFSAFNFRSTFFDLYPARTNDTKGLLVYHTSIMLLSAAEKRIIENFRKKGWNVMVGLPPDSLYRIKLPALASAKGTTQGAAELVAEDMDRHYLEQARTTRVALDYLAQTRPDWLTKKRVLMGTSAGTFGLPAEALMNPGWDALIFVSGGTNLLSLYESGSAGLFKKSLQWARHTRKAPPKGVTRIFSDEEYHEIFRKAATMTNYHSGALAPLLRDQKILMISGNLDQIIPKNQALGLHQALGKPERWTAPLGHHLIALQLILEVDRMDQWIMNTQPQSPR